MYICNRSRYDILFTDVRYSPLLFALTATREGSHYMTSPCKSGNTNIPINQYTSIKTPCGTLLNVDVLLLSGTHTADRISIRVRRDTDRCCQTPASGDCTLKDIIVLVIEDV
jgi:hypothetical protein